MTNFQPYYSFKMHEIWDGSMQIRFVCAGATGAFAVSLILFMQSSVEQSWERGNLLIGFTI